MPESERDEFVSLAGKIVEKAGFDPEYYLVEDKAVNIPYSFYSTDASETKNLIFVEQGYSRPQIREISSVSPAVRGLQEGYRIHRICFPAELKNDVAKLYHRA